MKRIIFGFAVILMSFMLCSCQKEIEPQVEQIKTICELSTVKVYYNNVAKSTKKAGEGFLNVLEKDREFWIEYDGVAEIGIDMNDVEIDMKGSEVCVTLPDAKVLNIRIVKETFDESCFITSADSWWDKNKITADDQQTAIKKAQDEMIKSVNLNDNLFERAEKIAKDTIENYFDKLGSITGTGFNIKWKEKSA